MTAERMPPNAVRARVKRISNKPPQRHAMIFSIKKGDKANALPPYCWYHTLTQGQCMYGFHSSGLRI